MLVNRTSLWLYGWDGWDKLSIRQEELSTLIRSLPLLWLDAKVWYAMCRKFVDGIMVNKMKTEVAENETVWKANHDCTPARLCLGKRLRDCHRHSQMSTLTCSARLLKRRIEVSGVFVRLARLARVICKSGLLQSFDGLLRPVASLSTTPIRPATDWYGPTVN